MDTTLSPPAGQLLDGRYRVESRLARGGMATVYLATDTRLDRKVALKIAYPELAADPEFVRRFIGEAHSAAKLSSPNVVAVFDQGSDGGLYFLAMEYVPGLTLRELLRERGRLSPREALDIIEGVLAGLAEAHRSGIVHRDVKPENVLLGSGNVVKVADFGLARAIAAARQSRAGMIIGTAAYLAPEQVSAGASDERTDVYAAGILLFELLTGSQPHAGGSALDVAYKHLSDTVPPPSSLVPGLPAALDALIGFATSRDPRQRPADAGHFLAAVGEVRHGLPISRRPPAAPGPVLGGPVLGGPVPGGAAPGGSMPGGQPVPGTSGGTPYRPGAHAQRDASPPPDAAWRPANPGGQPPGGQPPGAGGGLATLGFSGQPTGPEDDPLLPAVLHSGRDSGRAQAANHTLIVPAPGAYYGEPGGHGQRGWRGARRSPRQWLFSRVGAASAGVAIVLIAVLGAVYLSRPHYRDIPQLRGMVAATARTELRNLGFGARNGQGQHNDLPAGSVISTSPASGARLKDGSTVTLILSLGPVKVTMPPVTGMALSSAEATLHQAGLTPGRIIQATSTTIPAGTVISTSPTAGSSWPQDKPVTLTVSAGQPLPDFKGQTVDQANATAASGGYTINPVQARRSTQPQGTIIRQSPRPGTAISQGEVVTVYFSPGPPDVTIPDVTGQDAHQAAKVLEEAGFNVQVQQVGPGNRVVSFSPTGSAPKGTTITLMVGFAFP
ncbi:MAG TPA: PASTA domain-containing protein [Streptosporangiaceae bacterium]|jgi:serine/threonine-protein kinase